MLVRCGSALSRNAGFLKCKTDDETQSHREHEESLCALFAFVVTSVSYQIRDSNRLSA